MLNVHNSPENRRFPPRGVGIWERISLCDDGVTREHNNSMDNDAVYAIQRDEVPTREAPRREALKLHSVAWR
jgi:hypothetical protein